jgi:4-diphosphocytidyl-2-C-methyl-D-erythritol kinase
VGARVRAQAKINLFLRILARENNGYHQIETLFCRIALADVVTVIPATSGRSLECGGEGLPPSGLGPVEQNLAWRAAVAYADLTGFPTGFRITIDKRIPVSAGLGGGSADAGAVLRALNALNPSPVGQPDLLRLAGSLGADVPFLTQEESALALAWGRGDRMATLPVLPTSAVWLLVPDVGVSSRDAYQWFDEDGGSSGAAVIPRAQLGSWSGVAAVAANDFEDVVGRRIPRIAQLLEALRTEAFRTLLGPGGTVVMSGSGSAIAVISGQSRAPHESALPRLPAVKVIETETAGFVEPVVLTH